MNAANRIGGGRRLARLDLKEASDEGTFSGYASLFHERDLGGDMVMPGAFRKSLIKRGVEGIRLLFQHDPTAPVGVWRQLFEDERGLFVEGRLLLEIDKAREIHALLQAGGLDGLSIGFRTVRAVKDSMTGGRRLIEVDLWEISIVTFPLLPQARIGRVKSGIVRTNGANCRNGHLTGALRRTAELMRT